MSTSNAWDPPRLLDSPYFEPIAHLIARLSEAGGKGSMPGVDALNALARFVGVPVTGGGHPLHFVAQEHGRLPFERQYEPRCYLHGELQTRENNWHDFFNALVWLSFPESKGAINTRHYRLLTEKGEGAPGHAADIPVTSQRGKGRDMLTLLDESGVIVPCADAGLAAMLRGFQWKELFWHQRERLVSGMGFHIFGHGLYDKALSPYVGMTGQGLIVEVPSAFFGQPLAERLAWLDHAVASYLSKDGGARTEELTPVPLLGVPGWSTQSMSGQFYEDSRYFRPGRRSAGNNG